MDYIIKEEKLELKYEYGKGAWTYHLRIPNTKNIPGKWGDIRVSGLIDNYIIENRNLAPTKGEDMMLSINSEIRKAINKQGGDIVTVSLYLLSKNEKINEKQIIETFKESGVLEAFNKLNQSEKNEIFESIISQKIEEKQIKVIIKHIDKLSK
ncbi:DUF1905 domain-containing protein [Flavobacterium turcicum]|uniref:DUF1905 domain-containing protein n=1 Tax=Flavobacterium turcicum TaxID=2764718 RepID=A0ABR7JEW2_9FLAO|nr:DUF1905 domain-containing protein [Flavobacterium turcicum]MBC5862796.1 DUF1905 domain-containing protein [Flavobacterium turcicum]NHL01528.1 DUF1905 domain-containing protein [Flavobacterium turcicum]